jgi:hypothetical protein
MPCEHLMRYQVTDLIVHYWTGYGSLCNTADARKRNSLSAPSRHAVTCESCKTLIAKLDEFDREMRAPVRVDGAQ